MIDTHILIVEDDPFTAKLLTALLTDSGYRATALADPRTVVAFLADETIGLVLLDVTPRDIDGLALAAQLCGVHPDIPIVFLAARGTVGEKVRCFEQGGDDYIVKPFEPRELLARIDAVLRRYRRAKRDVVGTTFHGGDATLTIGAARSTAPEGHSAPLTSREMKILECLLRNANAMIARETSIARTGDTTTKP